ncbi:MAG: hypothetical protein ABI759_21970 [Candidatus Solibacter sp.]
MTPKEFTEKLPRLTNSPLPLKPPFLFNGLSTRVFPLRASMGALQELCDSYLNFVPENAARFRAYLPYVFLMVLDYGQIGEAAMRLGWFAQFEVFFSVPVEWYKLVDGQWVFQDWAVFTPYIFVNDAFSVPLGREVYGFPKVLANMTSVSSEWVRNPQAPVTLVKVETSLFPEAYAGRGLEVKTFLEIERAAPMSNLQVPVDSQSPAMPWVIASNMAEAAAGFAQDAMWMAQSRRIFPINPLYTPGIAPELLARMAPIFSPSGQGFISNSLNLKQFRRCEDPANICYQSLTNGQMRTIGFNGAGLLGEERTALGDMSGGHTVRLYQHSSLPIARVLGLDVKRKWSADGNTVMEFKPVMPFWMNIDLIYDKGINIAQRGPSGVWRDGGGNVLSTEPSPGEEPGSPAFNGSIASAVEAIAGPFQFCGSTVRVLPLLASVSKMQTYVDYLINSAIDEPMTMARSGESAEVRLRVWSRPATPVNSGNPLGGDLGFVYLTASSFGGVTSKTNNVGDWAKFELSFLIPVKWERRIAGEWVTVGVGAVPAFTFVDDCIASISRNEVQGIQALTAGFVRPESVWLKEGQANIEANQTVLRMEAEVWPAVGADQKAVTQKLIEIIEHADDSGMGEVNSPDVPYQQAEQLRLEQGSKKSIKARYPGCCKVARALALELLGNRTPFSMYTMKQFRDVTDPDKACHQAITRVKRVLKEVLDVREIEQPLTVQIHDYPSLQIVETLGLVAVTPSEQHETGIVYLAQAVRPFYIHGTIDEPLADRVADRTGLENWTIYPVAFDTLLSDAEGAPPISVDRKAEALQDQIDPCRMTAVMYQARERLRKTDQQRLSDDEPPITKQQARTALRHVDPQMVIDAVLSREWGNTSQTARWRRGRQELIDMFAKLPLGGLTNGEAMAKLCRQVNFALAQRPGAVATPIADLDPGSAVNVRTQLGAGWSAIMGQIILSAQIFQYYRNYMEENYEALSSWELHGADPAKYPQEAVDNLREALKTINGLKIVGEPSERNNLDSRVLADHSRFGELLEILLTKHTVIRVDDLDYVLDLARRYCGVQINALLNKLSRAYQKPDFCVPRDVLGADADRYLPLSLSWDADWYFGRNIVAVELGGTAGDDCVSPDTPVTTDDSGSELAVD